MQKVAILGCKMDLQWSLLQNEKISPMTVIPA